MFVAASRVVITVNDATMGIDLCGDVALRPLPSSLLVLVAVAKSKVWFIKFFIITKTYCLLSLLMVYAGNVTLEMCVVSVYLHCGVYAILVNATTNHMNRARAAQ